MVRWFRALAVTATAAAGVAIMAAGCAQSTGNPGQTGGDKADGKGAIGELIAAGQPLAAPPSSSRPGSFRPGVITPVVISDSRIVVLEKQEVSSQRDGQILFIGTEVNKSDFDRLKDYQRLEVQVGDKKMLIRRLNNGDPVKAGDLLGYVDPVLALDDLAIKQAKVEASRADFDSSKATREEAKNREIRSKMLRDRGTIGQEEFDGAVLTAIRYKYEAISKEQAIKLSQREENQAQTILGMHEVRSKIDGVIKAVHKHRGEAVRTQEPMLFVYNPSRLRIEGLMDLQHYGHVHSGDRVHIEPTRYERPGKILTGHLQEVNAVAAGKDTTNPTVVSGSEDGTVRVWDPIEGRERRILRPGSAVKALACTGTDARSNHCVAGCADGSARLYDLATDSVEPFKTLDNGHRGPITCVAFNSDGKWCVTGGEDRAICMWEVDGGKLKYRFPVPDGHRGRVTAVQFLPGGRLLSAGADNTLRLWEVGTEAAKLIPTAFERRSGDVMVPTASPDGKRVLFDQGKELRVLSLPDGRFEGSLQNPSGAMNFTTMAVFSPDGKVILAAGGGEGRLQLWKAPGESPSDPSSRAYELRQLVYAGGMSTCGSFAPSGNYVVTGTKDAKVLIWQMPSREDVALQLTSELVIEPSVDSTSSVRQVRVWAYLENPKLPDGSWLLMPGNTATMVVFPTK